MARFGSGLEVDLAALSPINLKNKDFALVQTTAPLRANEPGNLTTPKQVLSAAVGDPVPRTGDDYTIHAPESVKKVLEDHYKGWRILDQDKF